MTRQESIRIIIGMLGACCAMGAALAFWVSVRAGVCGCIGLLGVLMTLDALRK